MSEAKEKKIKASDLKWTSKRPTEVEAKLPNGAVAYIKQSVGRLGALDTFWFCYITPPGDDGRRYCGKEDTIELAKARAVSGCMRMPADSLGEWLERHRDIIPDDLYEAERRRFEAWKKNPAPRVALTEPVIEKASPRSRTNGGSSEAGAAVPKQGRPVKPSSRGERPTGKLPQDAKIVVLKRACIGKQGTKWHARQEAVFQKDGKRVRDARDDDALKNMIRDGQIKLET